MPTTDIIGYLWTKRQELDLYSLADVLQFTHDLVINGLDAIRVEDIEVFGIPTGEARVEYVRLTHEEWEPLITDLIVSAAAADAVHMIHEESDDQ